MLKKMLYRKRAANILKTEKLIQKTSRKSRRNSLRILPGNAKWGSKTDIFHAQHNKREFPECAGTLFRENRRSHPFAFECLKDFYFTRHINYYPSWI